jgi:tRNA pseudouridine(38-40) synthase
MKRYMMTLSYIGSQYRGSQKHIHYNLVDSDSIQGTLENILFKLEPKFINTPKLVMSGRTDAGVHALCTAAHIDFESHLTNTNWNVDNFITNINRILINKHHNIRILSIQEVNNEFHARFSAKSRTYLYRFIIPKYHNLKIGPISELQRSAIVHNDDTIFDFNYMKKGVDLFMGTKDFNSFASVLKIKKKSKQHYKNFVKTMVLSLEETKPLMPLDPISKNYSYWNFIFTSKSFLYNQIRRIVGTLFALGFHKISEEDIINMLQVPSYNNWNSHIRLAPPYGLYLSKVDYHDFQNISNL